MITAERVRELLHYDPDTGVFAWKVDRGVQTRAGSRAGWTTSEGYIGMKVDRRSYQAHRLAWLYVYGDLPPAEIDHINRDKRDNRIANLRLADRSLNCRNVSLRSDSTTGVRGVHFNKTRGAYTAHIFWQKRVKYLGAFQNLEDAVAARRSAENRLWSDTSNSAQQ